MGCRGGCRSAGGHGPGEPWSEETEPVSSPHPERPRSPPGLACPPACSPTPPKSSPAGENSTWFSCPAGLPHPTPPTDTHSTPPPPCCPACSPPSPAKTSPTAHPTPTHTPSGCSPLPPPAGRLSEVSHWRELHLDGLARIVPPLQSLQRPRRALLVPELDVHVAHLGRGGRGCGGRGGAAIRSGQAESG